MDDFFGYKIGFFINKSLSTPAPTMFSFSVSDNIYSAFPMLDFNYPDNSGLFLEYGNFTQGIPLNIKFGIASKTDMLDVNFRSSRRDSVSLMGGTPGLTGNLSVKGIHESFFKGRKSPHIALKEIIVSDAVKKLFPSETKLKIETTKGKLSLTCLMTRMNLQGVYCYRRQQTGKYVRIAFSGIYLMSCILRVLSYWKVRLPKRS
jgi:hypothetical protein